MDLTTTYLGLNLRNPIVASSTPLSRDLDGIRRLEDAGAAAVVLPSLFEEEIEQEGQFINDVLDSGTESYSEAISYLPAQDKHLIGPDAYLKTIRKAKDCVGIPIIGSLNGVSAGGWMKYARLMEQAGADALEINLYYLATDVERTSQSLEQSYMHAVRSVRKRVNLPLAVKLPPFFTSLPNLARNLAREQVDGIVLFNRFYQPDFDLEKMEVVPSLAFSRSDDLRLPLRWTAILYGRLPMDLAITTGVHTHIDVLKAVMAGANVAMMASELLEKGTGRIHEILGELSRWMDEHEYESIKQMRGSMSQQNVHDPAAFERANYMKVLHSRRFVPT